MQKEKNISTPQSRNPVTCPPWFKMTNGMIEAKEIRHIVF